MLNGGYCTRGSSPWHDMTWHLVKKLYTVCKFPIHFPMRWSIIILDHSSSRDLHSIVGNRIMVLVLVVFVSVFVDIQKSKTSSCASTTSNFPASSLPTLTWSYFHYSTLSLYWLNCNWWVGWLCSSFKAKERCNESWKCLTLVADEKRDCIETDVTPPPSRTCRALFFLKRLLGLDSLTPPPIKKRTRTGASNWS